jgi:APA family basic amino acid/polyamine antiporter
LSTPGTAPETHGRLVRAMGRWTLAALVVNAILGSGIFGLPATLSRLLGPTAIWAWVLGAIGNGVVMACFAEVASRFSEAGGAYLYARTALPRLVAILVGWLAFLTRLTAAAAGANLLTTNLVEFLPAAERPGVRVAILTLLLGGMAILNLVGVQRSAASNNFFTVTKLLPLLFLLAAGAWWLASHTALTPAPLATPAAAGDWLTAGLLVAFAYGGYDGALMAMGEARNPRRDAPFALFVAMLFLLALYGGIQLVVDHVVPAPGSQARPLVEAARVVIGGWGAKLLALGAILSVVGYLGANFLAAPRLLFALTEQRDLPAVFGRVHPRWKTPHVAILVLATSVWGMAVYGNFVWNATLSAVARLFVYAATCSALLVLRRREAASAPAAATAAFRLPGGRVFAVLGIGFCLVLALRLGAKEYALLGGFCALATTHWLVVRRS